MEERKLKGERVIRDIKILELESKVKTLTWALIIFIGLSGVFEVIKLAIRI